MGCDNSTEKDAAKPEIEQTRTLIPNDSPLSTGRQSAPVIGPIKRNREIEKIRDMQQPGGPYYTSPGVSSNYPPPPSASYPVAAPVIANTNSRGVSPFRYTDPVPTTPTGFLRRSSVMATEGKNAMTNWDSGLFKGPGFAGQFSPDNVYRCFPEGNGLLFRLVDRRHHLWAFYNDTKNYDMHVCVTFGHESVITPFEKTRKEVINEETGSCILEAHVPPGQLLLFMRGEYNGFRTVYEAVPCHSA